MGCPKAKLVPRQFFGYYTACEADYWYHGASGGYPNGGRRRLAVEGYGEAAAPECVKPHMGVGGDPTDLSNNSGTDLRPAPKALNGTYNTALFAEEAARLVRAHPVADPFYMYLVSDATPSLKQHVAAALLCAAWTIIRLATDGQRFVHAGFHGGA